MQNLIEKKKKNENKPTELVAKSKAQGLPNKPGGCMIGAAAENQKIKHETTSLISMENLVPTAKDVSIKLLKIFEVTKAAGIDHISGNSLGMGSEFW